MTEAKRNHRIGPLRHQGLLSAGLRALESISPRTGIVSDEHAEPMAGEVGVDLARQVEEEFPFLRDSILSRQRFVDDWASGRIREGGQTVFSIASGVETRIPRLPIIEEMRAKVLEIDSKPMLLLKLHRLHALFGGPPDCACFIESKLPHRLPLKTLQRLSGMGTRPAVFVLEGVVSVLDPLEVETLLRDICSVRVARRSIVFDYFEDSEGTRQLVEAGFARAYTGGVPRFVMSPKRVARALERLGYRKIVHRSLTEISGYYGRAIPEVAPIQVVTAEAISGS